MLRLSMQAVLRTSQSKLHATPFLHPHPSLNASPLLLRAVSTVVPVHTTPRKKKRKGNSPQHASKPSSHPHPNQKTSLVNKSNASVLGSTNATQEKLQEPSTVVEPAAATTPSDKDVPQPATSGTPKRGDHHASSSTDLVVSATQPSTKGHAQKKAAIATKPPTSPLVEEAQVVIGLLEEIAQRQRALPSAAHVTTMLNYTSRDQEDTFFKLFELYRKHGNSNVDSTFLIPGVVKCCEVGNSKQAVAIATDMVNNDALKVLDLLLQEGHLVTTQDYQRILAICTADHHEDGALRILQALRPLTTIASDTYLHWLSRSAMVWRADIFLALLQEMRLSGVEPRIPSLTSLEVGRKDPALTVMEGVRAVGLDPCFAMSAVYESIAKAIGKGDRRDGGVTRRQRETALEKYGSHLLRKLEWEVQPIPQLLETQAAGLLLKKETFRRLKYQQVTRVESYLNMLPITTNVTLNLRKQLLRMSLLVNTHRVKRNKYMILGEYERGKSLIDLSNIHNYPPVSLMRIILEARGMSPRAIKVLTPLPPCLGNIFRESEPHIWMMQNALAAPGDLTPRDNNELNRAKLNDSIHRNDPLLDLPDYTSSSLETTLMHYFISKGIREKIYGRAVISPDLLLLDPVLINGVPVRWIDAKNYYGAHIVNKRLIAKQLASYVKEWGPGAVVYGMGYSDMISIPGVVCLDMTPIPKTSWGKFKMVTKSYMYTFRNLFRWAPHLGSELTQEYLTSNDLTEVNRERGAQERLERSAAKSAKNPVAAEKKEVE
ncbi:hypothetical protein DYB37_002016 [Aphanomyces astaci]|uniref:CDAN1-interacting nuclease 1 n=2 Tax=Aphanomyces astaci TaxID=112090 RepID=A0A397D181_APHAT|nr:hypothetical protein DYB36_008929 [Aphanomyces astaci]RHY11583.1 hypothetical protein DYB25_004527 [Aphanomyces astaci]RHY56927.1 hypothetical protein DYB38_000223 [Aphanomyces astaci]RHY81310.1 hypothetical protein DYB35_001265 [Aphanomyces astaci]RHZ23596.1 hypothetical protein DYB37_002016 [Aphanomyces astaci]